MDYINIERAILSTFLWSNDYGINTNDVFILNPDVFCGERKSIIHLINNVTKTDDKYYGLLNLTLENTMQNEWLFIAEQTPLGSFNYTKKNYKFLEDQYKLKLLRRQI